MKFFGKFARTVIAVLVLSNITGIGLASPAFAAPAPTVTSISVNRGALAGGSAVTITGTNFVSTPTITLGGVAATSVLWISSTSLTALTPAHTAGQVSVVVTNPDAQLGTLINGYTYEAAPRVNSVSPGRGALAGGTAVTISGSGFLTGAMVTFAGTAATSVLFLSASTLTAITPAHAAGQVNVVVTNPDAQVGTGFGIYDYASAPTVTSVSPIGGLPSGGTAVTIIGTGFSNSAAITFGGVVGTSIVRVSSTTLTAVTPAHAAGPVNVVVTNPDAQTGTWTNVYNYEAAPTVTSISPAGGALAGGTAVTINGTGFVNGATITIGGVAASSVLRVSSTTLTAVAAIHIAGLFSVVVTNPDSQIGTLTNGYSYAAAPTISSISPSAGALAGGTTVTITGTNFTATPTVKIGGSAATSVLWLSSTTLTAVIPTHSAGAFDVVITNPDTQLGTLTNGYTYAAAPTVLSLLPATGLLSGATAVTITGTGFASGAAITFGGLAATSVVWISASSLTAVTPAHALGTVDVVVTNPDAQLGTGFGIYTFAPATHSVTYSLSGGTGPLPNQSDVAEGASFTTALSTGLSKPGYTFSNWNDGISDIAANVNYTMSTIPVILTAIWSGNALNIIYNSQGGSSITTGSTSTGGSILASPGIPTRNGYTFTGWFVAATGGSAITFPYLHGQIADFTLYAQWSTVTYSLSYSVGANGTLTGSISQIVAFGGNGSSVTAVAKPGYHFLTWSDGVGTATRTDLAASIDINVTATFAMNPIHKVTYSLGGGSGTLPNQLDVAVGANFTTASSAGLTMSGFTFNKWNDGQTDYSAGANYMMSTTDVTLTATWSASEVTQPPPVTAQIQSSTISGISPSSGLVSGGYIVTISGSFPTAITGLTCGGVALAAGSWIQTATTIKFTMGAHAEGKIVCQLDNGLSPLLALQDFTYIANPTPTPTPSSTPTPTHSPTPAPSHTPKASPPKILIDVKIYFSMGSSVIKGANLVKIKTLALNLRRLGNSITTTITGYAQPTPGSEKTDGKLSADRADTVAKQLRAAGVNSTITYAGLGRAKIDAPSSRYVEIVAKK